MMFNDFPINMSILQWMFPYVPMIFPLTGDCSNPPSAAGLFSTDLVRPLPCGIVSWRSAVPNVNVNSPGIHPEIFWWKSLASSHPEHHGGKFCEVV